MSDFLGYLFMVILNLYGIPFHAVVVVSPEHDFLFKSDSTYCGRQLDCSLLKITLPGGFLGASRGLPEGIFGLIGSLLHGITKLYTFVNHISFTFYYS